MAWSLHPQDSVSCHIHSPTPYCLLPTQRQTELNLVPQIVSQTNSFDFSLKPKPQHSVIASSSINTYPMVDKVCKDFF